MLPRRTPLRRSGRLPARSSKRAAYYRTVRRPLVARLLEGDPPCSRCLTAPAVDVHEILSRARGGSLDDPANLAVLCRPCHDWITTHPAEATLEGWLRATQSPPEDDRDSPDRETS